MTTIRFAVTPKDVTADLLVTVPAAADTLLPARSTVVVEGMVNQKSVRIPLEPDGMAGHWFVLGTQVLKKLGAKPGSKLVFELAPTKNWPEPKVPAALKTALTGNRQALATWQSTTVVARWEWVRWFGMVKTEQTRRDRPAKIISMLAHGKKRPCCFNRSMQEPPKKAVLR